MTVPGTDEREVTLTEGGLPDELEVEVMRNGQQVGSVRIVDA